MINIIPTPKICNETAGEKIKVFPSVCTEHKEFEKLCKAFATDFYKVTDCRFEIGNKGFK